MSLYTKNFSLVRQSFCRSTSKSHISFHFSKKIFILNLILLSLIFIILVFYLIKINQIIILGFKISELEKRVDELKEINKTLKLEKIKLESLNNIQSNLNTLGLVKPEKIEYFKPIESISLTRK
ncbi:MAG: hypothetical protein ACK413_00070 [Patescibacteria group bacterium]